MSKFSFHTDRRTATRLKNELPDGEEWGEYILECVELREKIEGRDLVLTEPGEKAE